jgi:hypothetical protein
MADYIERNGEIVITKAVFKNQPLSLSAMPTGADLTNATAVVFKYEKPNNDRGQFTNAGSIDSPPATGNVSLTIDANELDQAGGEQRPWIIWAYITDSNGSYPGTRIIMPVYEEGTK